MDESGSGIEGGLLLIAERDVLGDALAQRDPRQQDQAGQDNRANSLK
jgi:hypothetical protein